ncbi:protein ninH [Rouxiella sp. Mn2063]|uniref:protein ninH n=1 Tax=Rouxiella sp. Mn2063 TaxID=3395262 RepID=UPI003BE7A046
MRKDLTPTICTVAGLLLICRNNKAKLSRLLNVNRSTILKYEKDTDFSRHAVVNNVLMIKTNPKRRRDDTAKSDPSSH